MKFQSLPVRLVILCTGIGSHEHIMMNDLKRASKQSVYTSNIKG